MNREDEVVKEEEENLIKWASNGSMAPADNWLAAISL